MGRQIPVTDAPPRELIKPGSYRGHVCGVYHIGTQDSPYGAKEQLILEFEVHKRKGPLKNQRGEVFTVVKFYDLYMSPKAKLRKDSEALLNRELKTDETIDTESLLGCDCRLAIKNGKNNQGQARNEIDSISPPDDEDDAIVSEANEVYYEPDPSKPISDDVPKWLHKFILQSHEMRGGQKSGSSLPPSNGHEAVDESDDAPF